MTLNIHYERNKYCNIVDAEASSTDCLELTLNIFRCKGVFNGDIFLVIVTVKRNSFCRDNFGIPNAESTSFGIPEIGFDRWHQCMRL